LGDGALGAGLGLGLVCIEACGWDGNRRADSSRRHLSVLVYNMALHSAHITSGKGGGFSRLSLEVSGLERRTLSAWRM
jgi:hypothetical protein